MNLRLQVLLGGLMLTAMLAAPLGGALGGVPEGTVPGLAHPENTLAKLPLPTVEGGSVVPPTVPTAGAQYAVGFVDAPPVRPGETFHGSLVLDVNTDIRFATVRVEDTALFTGGMVADDRVLYYEPDLLAMRADFTPNDPQYANQYDLKPATSDAQTAWDTTKGSTSAKVCVTDTGIRATHEDLTGATRYYWKDEVGGQAGAYDDNGHGTHVSGTIAAVINNGKGIAGVAQVSLGMAKVLNSQGSGTFTQIANGITDCKNSGAHVISMSLGCDGGIGSTCDSTTMHNAVTSAYNAGVLVVAAAGNAGPCTNCVGLPAAYSEAIAITCSNESNAFCSFSSEGPEAFVMAPGNNIVSTYKNSDTNYATLSGTSMSTPHVAGEAGLIKTLNPSWDRVNIKDKIKTSAVSQGLSQNRQGYGLINYKNAVGGGAPTAPGAPTLTATAGNAQVSLSWTAPGDGGSAITSYKVYRGTTSGGEALVTSGGCSGLGNVLSCTDGGLTNGQAYYYQVSAVNGVGEGSRSAERSATPAAATTYFSDDFENGGANWNSYNYGFGSTWAIYTTSYHSATHAIECGDGSSYATNTDCGARSRTFSLSGATTAKLKFWHKIGGELSGGTYYDYGIVWASKDGGSSWCQLATHLVNVASWTQKTYDLSVCAGVIGSANALVEFEFVSDGSVQNNGWFVDDVTVTST
jgi:thermitase